MNHLLIPNSCQVPNIILDAVMRKVSHAEFKVLMAIVRKTYGWHKKSDRISLSQFVELTSVSERKVIDSLRSLKWIINTHKLPNGTTEYSLNIEAVVSVDGPELSSGDGEDQNPELAAVGSELSSEFLTENPEVSSDTKPNLKPTITKPTNNTPTPSEKKVEKNRFEEFWKAYPRKRGKGQAERAWRKNAKGNVDRILAALKEQKQWPDWRKEEGKYIPYPATWLNSKRWEDERDVQGIEKELPMKPPWVLLSEREAAKAAARVKS